MTQFFLFVFDWRNSRMKNALSNEYRLRFETGLGIKKKVVISMRKATEKKIKDGTLG